MSATVTLPQVQLMLRHQQFLGQAKRTKETISVISSIIRMALLAKSASFTHPAWQNFLDEPSNQILQKYCSNLAIYNEIENRNDFECVITKKDGKLDFCNYRFCVPPVYDDIIFGTSSGKEADVYLQNVY
ncbi:MAG: hypothetical protein K5683_03375 [Prevotella sp.]|nr:hypothetical protein [Prevotella sp.]